MNVSDAFVFPVVAVLLQRGAFRVGAFRVGARDRGAQAAQVVTTVSERDLRDQQNAKDDKNE